MGAGGNVLQWSFASAAAVPAVGSTIEGDGGGAATDAGGGESMCDGQEEDESGGDAGAEVTGGDSETTPDESAALLPWVDPLLHPTTMTPSTTEQAAARRAAFIRSPRRCRSSCACAALLGQ
jgi:hypothetical protein